MSSVVSVSLHPAREKASVHPLMLQPDAWSVTNVVCCSKGSSVKNLLRLRSRFDKVVRQPMRAGGEVDIRPQTALDELQVPQRRAVLEAGYGPHCAIAAEVQFCQVDTSP